MKYFAGIDVGNTGGIAVLDEYSELVAYTRMPIIKVGKKHEVDVFKVTDFLGKIPYGNCDELAITIEDVHAMPHQGVTSMFNFGKGYGLLLGLLQSMDFAVRRVSPRRWQKELLLPKTDKDDNTKARANRTVLMAYPDLDKYLKVKRNQGVADAILIATFGLQEYQMTFQ